MNGKVLLVDDELHITRNLEKVIPWSMLGLEITGSAKNGVEALELLEAEPADLVLCDIRMPVMDGLELVRNIRERGIRCDVIMLSGYQDFSYTRSAIQYGVKDYILKPIPYDELTGVIARVMSEQRSKRSQDREDRRKLQRIIDMANEKLMYDVLMDYTDLTPDHWLMAGQEQLIGEPQYSLIVFDIDAGSADARDWREWPDKERKIWNFAVCNVLRETLHNEGLQHAVIQMRDGEWSVLLQLGRMDELPVLTEAEREERHGLQVVRRTEQLLEAVLLNAKLRLHAGIYRKVAAMNELSEAYKTVQRGMQLSTDLQPIALYGSELPCVFEAGRTLWDIAERLIGAMKRGDASGVGVEQRRIAEQLRQAGGGAEGRLKPLLHFLALHLMRELKEADLLSRAQEEALWRKMDSRFGVKDLFAAIQQASNEGVARSTDKRGHSELQMAQAKQYIDRHLFRDLGVEETATYVGLSTSHFSLLFKSAYGETFIEYVTRQRMETAKSLLEESNKSVAQIAKEVGYSERRYFTKVFMKYAGQNPTDYRMALQGVETPVQVNDEQDEER
ncbi:response regulator transcription factor [Paenibacillus sacheonensis]|uniref:Response regulator n=1 Tax=Paenibacillus sacheonensis TaxID=742054 RepID=A0A7X4YSJ7_9BACL|nr:response regulator [Paenibacillus sacheonensis]MBM7569206.1 two-component system response regulator YesN [Paenibacillus sacheonensis]NBC71782.1 response regulator [Paenibacillus sacheonensis]